MSAEKCYDCLWADVLCLSIYLQWGLLEAWAGDLEATASLPFRLALTDYSLGFSIHSAAAIRLRTSFHCLCIHISVLRHLPILWCYLHSIVAIRFTFILYDFIRTILHFLFCAIWPVAFTLPVRPVVLCLWPWQPFIVACGLVCVCYLWHYSLSHGKLSELFCDDCWSLPVHHCVPWRSAGSWRWRGVMWRKLAKTVSRPANGWWRRRQHGGQWRNAWKSSVVNGLQWRLRQPK